MPLEADTTNPHSQIPQQPSPPPQPPPLPPMLSQPQPQLQPQHHPHTSQSSSSNPRNKTSTSKTINLRTKPSPFIQKLQHAPASHWFESSKPSVEEINLASPVGWYFLYGTLMDPSFLAKVLSLPPLPPLPPLPSRRCQPEKMRPAKIVGYAVKLWGQYPALLDGEAGQEVHGMAWRVREKKDAVRLVEYETRAYRPAPCLIEFTTEEEEEGDDDDDDDGGSGGGGDDGVKSKNRPVRGKGTVLQGYAFKFRDGNESELQEGNFDLKSWLRSIGR